MNEILKIKVKRRWQLIDKKYNSILKNRDVECPICNYNSNTKFLKKRYSKCIFNGGILERYECPYCNVIFGPLKMFDLTEEEFNNEYEEYHKIYKTKDHSKKEINTFMQMKPNKKGIYINYGSGSLSYTIEKLRKQKYKVFGYEPFTNVKSKFIISKKEELNKIVPIDGVFSNNLLEHLKNPISSLKEMSKAIKKNCKMSHSTPCYKYCYEFTRFHLFFFTGKSLDIICEKSGLKKEKKYNLGYVFKKI
jgi:hypothetical protein